MRTVIGQDAYYRFRYKKEEYKLLIRNILYFTSDLRKTYIVEAVSYTHLDVYKRQDHYLYHGKGKEIAATVGDWAGRIRTVSYTHLTKRVDGEGYTSRWFYDRMGNLTSYYPAENWKKQEGGY